MAQLDISYRSIIKFALPIIFGAFVQSLILFVDSAFLSAYDTLAFAAIGNAGLLFISFFMLGSGLSDAGQIYIARMHGKDDDEEKRIGFQTNLINLLFIGIALAAVMWILNTLFAQVVYRSDVIAGHASDYLSVRLFGIIFSMLSLAVTSYFVGIGKSRILMYNTLLLCVVNIGLDYVLIFGHYGFPRLGPEGAAWATLIAELSVCIFSFAYLFKFEGSKKRLDSSYQSLLKSVKWGKTQSRRIFKIAIPLMIQGFIAVGAWTCYFFMIEQMGHHPLEVSQIIHKAYFLALIPMIGFSSTTKTYVSNLMAERNFVLIKTAMTRIILVNYLFVIVLIHGFILYPQFWIDLIDVNASATVIEDASTILTFITGSIMIHCSAMLYQNAIAGSGDTLAAMWLEIVSIVIYLVSVYLIIFVFELNIKQVWLSEYIYFSVFLIIALWYYKSGRWKTKKL